MDKYTHALTCGHCGNCTVMGVLVECEHAICEVDDGSENYVGDIALQLASCPVCGYVTFRQAYIDPSQPTRLRYEILYPAPRQVPHSLPEKVGQAYAAASRVRRVDANAYAVLLGRVLDLVCIDRSAEGETLATKLSFLAKKGEIPEKLVDVVASLRQFRNVGAHATIGDLTPKETSLLDDLCRAVLEYVYSAPALVRRARQSLEELKSEISA